MKMMKSTRNITEKEFDKLIIKEEFKRESNWRKNNSEFS
jgi:hypothetical protein